MNAVKRQAERKHDPHAEAGIATHLVLATEVVRIGEARDQRDDHRAEEHRAADGRVDEIAVIQDR